VTDSGNERLQKFTELDTRSAPCPDNTLTFGKLKLNKRSGTANFTVFVGHPGVVSMAGHGTRRANRFTATGGRVVLHIVGRSGVKRKLRRQHRAGIAVKVTYTPTNGDPNTKLKRLTLRKQQR